MGGLVYNGGHEMSAIDDLNRINSSIGGYTCPTCKAYIPNGVFHQCPGGTFQPNPAPSPQPVTRMDHGLQYVAALERIAAAIEKLAEAVAAGAVVSRTGDSGE
jgi:hypothetical protein